ncbi:uncharacterized protein LOC6538355 [Drosophila yakuba]|uniref:Chitin-binding type-2 domain-containing protein n=1 Tax=Drosophila yakuba TaxID=7245 RepID=B4PSC9_DROYA|nr:uncharacterized protein LOC6538355 [Drosophila yakuba]EDW98591.1 uncharacterized protein Dyak_GE23692 [Drosophila yakuba]
MLRWRFVMKLFMKNKWSYSPWMLLPILILTLLQLQLQECMAASAANTDTTTNATCRHATDMWGDPDPNKFYVCSDGGQPLQLECPPGRGFFSGLGYLGCLPYGHWPACRPTEEQVAAQLSAGCDSTTTGHVPSPWASPDPNRFYLCPSTDATPLLLNCAAGRGFVASSEMVGCADWSQWRRQMECEAYY